MDVAAHSAGSAGVIASAAPGGWQARLRPAVGMHGAGRLAAHAQAIAGIFLFLATVAAVPASAQERSEPVIYPRGSASGGQGSGAPAPAGGVNSLFLLVTAAGAAGAGWWLWSRRRTGLVNARAAKLSIVESRSLGSRQHLVVADYDGRKFLLSVCPGSIDLLTPLDGNPPPK